MPGNFPNSGDLANSEGLYLCDVVCISISRGNRQSQKVKTLYMKMAIFCNRCTDLVQTW